MNIMQELLFIMDITFIIFHCLGTYYLLFFKNDFLGGCLFFIMCLILKYVCVVIYKNG